MPNLKNELAIVAPLNAIEMLWAMRALHQFVRGKRAMKYDSISLVAPNHGLLSQFYNQDQEGRFDTIREIPPQLAYRDTFTESENVAIKQDARHVMVLSNRRIREVCAIKGCHFAEATYHFLNLTPPASPFAFTGMLREQYLLGIAHERIANPILWQSRPIFFLPSLPKDEPGILSQGKWVRAMGYIAQGRHQSIAMPSFVQGIEEYMMENPRIFPVGIETIHELAFWLLYSSAFVGENSWILQFALGLGIPTVWVGQHPEDHLRFNSPTLRYATKQKPGEISGDTVIKAFAALDARDDVCGPRNQLHGNCELPPQIQRSQEGVGIDAVGRGDGKS